MQPQLSFVLLFFHIVQECCGAPKTELNSYNRDHKTNKSKVCPAWLQNQPISQTLF